MRVVFSFAAYSEFGAMQAADFKIPLYNGRRRRRKWRKRRRKRREGKRSREGGGRGKEGSEKGKREEKARLVTALNNTTDQRKKAQLKGEIKTLEEGIKTLEKGEAVIIDGWNPLSAEEIEKIKTEGGSRSS